MKTRTKVLYALGHWTLRQHGARAKHPKIADARRLPLNRLGRRGIGATLNDLED